MDTGQQEDTQTDPDFGKEQEEDSQEGSDYDVALEEDTQISWISCIGGLKFLCEQVSMCERIIQKASATEALQPNVLLEELISATEKVKATSSALLIDAKKSLNQLHKANPTPDVSKVNDFMPISKDPGSRRKILTDEERIYDQFRTISTETWVVPSE